MANAASEKGNAERSPFFSIILPIYNREERVVAAVESVCKQSFQNWEMIIIDDGSTDHSEAVILPFLTDQRIRYVYQDNQERSAARNNGIRLAEGNFICFIDSDDYYLENHLTVLSDAIRDHNFESGLYYTHFFLQNQKGEIQPGNMFSTMKNRGLYNILNESLLQTNSVCVSSDLLKTNQFPLAFNLFEDNHLWMRVIAQSKMIFIPIATTVMVDHAERSLYVSKADFSVKVRKYKAVLTDLLLLRNYPELDNAISSREKKKFVASKYIVLTYEAYKLGMSGMAYSLLFSSLGLFFDRKRVIEYLKLLVGIPFGKLIYRNAK